MSEFFEEHGMTLAVVIMAGAILGGFYSLYQFITSL